MQGTFYLLPDEASAAPKTEPDTTVPAHFDLACHIAKDCFRRGQRVFIFTDSQQDAHLLDEHLWGFDADAFVPHNLSGEGPAQGAPVEISWSSPTNRRQVLINLAQNGPDFSPQFRQIIDFVPTEDTLKQQARERYKYYRQLGFTLATAPAQSTVQSPVQSNAEPNNTPNS